MSRFRITFASLTLCLILGAALGADAPLRSGLQPGERIETVFEPLNVNGEHAGELHCLVCENGLNPVAMIFARQVSQPLVRLIAKLDAAAAKNRQGEMGCFVVFLGEQEKLEAQVKAVAKEQKLKHVILSIDAPTGPEGFNVAQDADVTVVLYREHAVHANHAFKAGGLTDKTAEAVLADLPKILKK